MSPSDMEFQCLLTAQWVMAVAAGPRQTSWITADTWRMVDERASDWKSGLLNGEELQRLNWAIQCSLMMDRKNGWSWQVPI
jgi:hypothetical protein